MTLTKYQVLTEFSSKISLYRLTHREFFWFFRCNRPVQRLQIMFPAISSMVRAIPAHEIALRAPGTGHRLLSLPCEPGPVPSKIAF